MENFELYKSFALVEKGSLCIASAGNKGAESRKQTSQ
jgi:hypothetical protein